MLDKADKAPRSGQAMAGGPPLDFQEHLRRLEACGLLTRIDHTIDKDSELHPLVRWQFQGGLAEEPSNILSRYFDVNASGNGIIPRVFEWDTPFD